MAYNITNLENVSAGGSAASTRVTASLSIPANSMVLVFIHGTAGTTNWPGLDITISDNVDGSTGWNDATSFLNLGGTAFGNSGAKAFYKYFSGAVSRTMTMTKSSGTSIWGHDVVAVQGANAFVQGKIAGTNWQDTGNTHNQAVTLDSTPTSGNAVITFLGCNNDTSGAATQPSGYTSLSNTTTTQMKAEAAYHIATSTATIDWTDAGQGIQYAYAAAIELSGPSAEQEGFRFRNDDGSETTATWQAAQDTNVTHPLSTNLRLRCLVNATDDLASTAFTLRYKKSTDGSYIPVPTSSSYTPTKVGWGSAGATGTAVSVTISSGTDAGSTWIPQENDLILWFASSQSTIASSNDGSGWLNIFGSAHEINGTNHAMAGWYHFVTSAEATAGTTTYNPTVFTGSEVANVTAMVVRYADPSSPFHKTNSTFDNTTTVTPHVLAGLTGGNQPSITGCLVVSCVAKDGTGAYSTAPTGWTTAVASNTNQGKWLGTRDTATTSGVDVAATNITPSAGDEYISMTVAIKAAPAPPIYVSASSNITSGGENTTFQLTAPSGKSTSDFVTGRMWDDENGSDSIDITTSDYTELEWSLIAQSPAVDTDIYQFRVYEGNLPMKTYTVTPEWTIGTPGGGGTVRRYTLTTLGVG